MHKFITAVLLACISLSALAGTEFGGWQYGGNGQINGVLSTHGISTPFIQLANDANGYTAGVQLQPSYIGGFYGFVPPTQDYPGIMAALHAAIASPLAKNILFENGTYNLGSNYIPIVSGIGYIGAAPQTNYLTNHDSQGNSVVNGTIITGTNSVMMWDGASALSAVTTTIAAQTSLTTFGSTLISVPNSSLFTVGQRVYVVSPGGGFYPGIAYYVLSAANNTITLGLPDMVAIPANASTVLSIAASFPNDSTSGVLIKDLSCNSCTTFIQTGAQNTGGLQFSKIENIQVHGTPAYRTISLTNFNGIYVDRIFTNDGDGQYYGSNMPANAFQWGNSLFSSLLNSNNGGTSTSLVQHGLLFQSEIGSSFNEVHIRSAQNNNAYISTQTVTTGALTNGSANIPVANSALWPVGLPVWIGTAGNPNGFTTSLVYWVVSSSSNVIQLSALKGGTAVTSTGTATMLLESQGYSGLEFTGIGTGIIANCDITGLDIEGQSTVSMAFQHANVSVMEVNQVSTADAHVNVMGRAFSGLFASYTNAASTDFDSNSSPMYYGQRGTDYQNLYSTGIWYDTALGQYVLNLNPGNNPANADIQNVVTPAGGPLFKVITPVVDQIKPQDTSKSFTFPDGFSTFNGATGQTYTLPTITNNSTATSMLGWPLKVFNASANNLTVATNGTQTFMNQSGQTSMTLTPGQYAIYSACITNGGTLFWCVQTNGTL